MFTPPAFASAFLAGAPRGSHIADVTTLAEIEAAIAKLPPPEFRELLHKLNERDAAEWDRHIEDDAQSGELDRLYSRMMEEEGGQPKMALDEVLDDPKLSQESARDAPLRQANGCRPRSEKPLDMDCLSCSASVLGGREVGPVL